MLVKILSLWFKRSSLGRVEYRPWYKKIFFSCALFVNAGSNASKQWKVLFFSCISLASEKAAKNIVEHVQRAERLAAFDHVQSSQLGSFAYHAAVVKSTPISCGLCKMCDKEKSVWGSTQLISVQKQKDYFPISRIFLFWTKRNKYPNIQKAYRNDNSAALFNECIAKVTKDKRHYQFQVTFVSQM